MNFEPEKIVEQHFIISNIFGLSFYHHIQDKKMSSLPLSVTTTNLLSYTHVFENICDDMITNHISFKTYMN